MLTLSGFDNIICLQNLDETNITEIEIFGREQLHLFIPEGAKLEDYYYIYKNHPEMFKIVAGHKILLREIRMYSLEKGAEFFAKFIKRRTYQATESKMIEEGLKVTTVRPVKKTFHKSAEEHGKLLKLLVNRWINSVKDYDPSKQIQEIRLITIYNPNPDEVSGSVTCSVCNQDIKVSTQATQNGYKRWIISNFMRHFKNHIGLNKKNKANDANLNYSDSSQVQDNYHLSYDNSNSLIEWNCDQEDGIEIKTENIC